MPPIYEYKCSKCEHRFEEVQKMSDKPLKKCPECKKQALKKLISAGGFRISGIGVHKPTSTLD